MVDWKRKVVIDRTEVGDIVNKCVIELIAYFHGKGVTDKSELTTLAMSGLTYHTALLAITCDNEGRPVDGLEHETVLDLDIEILNTITRWLRNHPPDGTS